LAIAQYLSRRKVWQKQRPFPPVRFCCPQPSKRYYGLLRILISAFLATSAHTLYARLHGGLSRDGVRPPSFRSVLCVHPALYIPSSRFDFAWLVIHRIAQAFAPILNARRNHPTPGSSSITAWLKFTRLKRFTRVTGCTLARAHGLDQGPRLSGVAPAFQSPSTRTP